MLKLYIIGVTILIVAIVANSIASSLSIMTWYDFLNQLKSSGFKTISEIGALNILWLFIIYPIVLGSGYLIGLRIFNMIISN